MEVYNDFNHNLVNLFRCMRDRPMAFIKELGFYPLNSRDDFNAIKNFFKQEKYDDKYLDEELELTKIILPDLKAEEIIELYIKMKQDYDLRRAVMFLKLLRYSYSSGGKSFACQPFSVVSLFQLIEQVGKRLENTVIENQDFEVLIKHYDRDNAFFYCDPPYYQADQYYEAVSADGFDHQGLAEALFSMKGKFLLSYNDCAFIRELYTRPGIVIEGTTRLSNIAQRYDNGKQYPELLISNYDTTELARSCVQLTLFTELDTQEILNERIIYNGTI